MAKPLRWTRRALQRMDEVASYISQDNPANATAFVSELVAKVGLLAEQPLGKAGRVYGTREFVLHKHYVVVYRIKQGEVHILTVLHTARALR